MFILFKLPYYICYFQMVINPQVAKFRKSKIVDSQLPLIDVHWGELHYLSL